MTKFVVARWKEADSLRYGVGVHVWSEVWQVPRVEPMVEYVATVETSTATVAIRETSVDSRDEVPLDSWFRSGGEWIDTTLSWEQAIKSVKRDARVLFWRELRRS